MAHSPHTYRVPRPAPRNLSKEITGRCALAILGLGFLFGGWECVRTGFAIERDFDQRATHRFRDTRASSGSGIPFAAGVTLFVIGSPLLLAACVPVRVIERLLGRQTNNTLWQNPDARGSLRDMDSLL